MLQVIASALRKEHSDPHRFEKISNIIKQFKLSCRSVENGNIAGIYTHVFPNSKLQAQFKSMEVRNHTFAAFIDTFTPNTYVMVIMTDSSIRK